MLYVYSIHNRDQLLRACAVLKNKQINIYKHNCHDIEKYTYEWIENKRL